MFKVGQCWVSTLRLKKGMGCTGCSSATYWLLIHTNKISVPRGSEDPDLLWISISWGHGDAFSIFLSKKGTSSSGSHTCSLNSACHVNFLVLTGHMCLWQTYRCQINKRTWLMDGHQGSSLAGWMILLKQHGFIRMGAVFLPSLLRTRRCSRPSPGQKLSLKRITVHSDEQP